VTSGLTMARVAHGLSNLVDRARRGPVPVGLTPRETVWQERQWQLFRFAPVERRFATPILLIPSLINRWYVLDLSPGRSLVEWLVGRGHEVYCIDWGTPRPEDRYLELDDICDGAIGRAMRRAGRTSPDGQVHLLGYCLGGTLAAIHCAARPERIASLVALAAPIDFHQGGLLACWSTTATFDLDSLIDAFGNVPWPLMQASFQLLRPTLPLQKSVTLLERAWNDEFLGGFLAAERWGSDNVSFPGAAYRRYIVELYRENRLMTDRFALSGRPARLGAIECPTMVVSFESDNIVPHASATALLDKIGSRDKQHLHLAGGHVGAVVSRRAAEKLWPAMHEFWVERDGGSSVGLDAPHPGWRGGAAGSTTRPSATS
jgi:polyhydroxyalkanoate synthase subunit PhaC